MYLRVTDKTIYPEEAIRAVRHDSCGAISTFIGDVRNSSRGRNVSALEYEVFEPMLREELNRIYGEMKKKFNIQAVALLQRIGKLATGESSVIIAVSAPHRRDALEACGYAIEEFKKRAPVWKKEYYESRAEWIQGA